MKSAIRIVVIVLVLAFVLVVLPQPSPVAGALSVDSAPMLSEDSQPKSIYELNHSQEVQASGPTGVVTPGAWRNMRPTESFLRDISMLPSTASVNCVNADERSKGWIVGDGGVILSYCNGLWDQSITTESTPTNLFGVAAVTPTLAFATGDAGTILKYGWDFVADDYTWVKLPITVSNQTLYRIAVAPDASGTGFVAWAVGQKDPNINRPTLVRGTITPSGSLDDYGNPIYNSNWTNVTATYSNLPAVNLYFGIQALTANDIWAVGGSGTQGVAIHWNGSSWTPFSIGTKAFYGVHFRSPTDGWAVGEAGQIYHYNGSSWSRVSSPVTSTLIDISFAQDGTGWATGYDGVLLKYSDGQWSLFDDLRTDFWDYYALDYTSGHGWMVGQNPYKGIGGQILEYSDDAWMAVTPPTDNQLNDVIVLSDTSAWAVGASDSHGTTIIYWDGKHWQRWYQNDPPLPVGDLRTIDMLSPTNGWAAGDPPTTDAPAILLHWDGRRWLPSRNASPINVRTNALRLITVEDNGPQDFGWMVADTGNAEGKYDYNNGYWSANHVCGGLYHSLRGLSLAGSGSVNEIEAWSVGELIGLKEYFLRYQNTCASGYAWDYYQEAPACPGESEGGTRTDLFSVSVVKNPDVWGFASGSYSNRASLYQFDGMNWSTIYCQPASASNPSRFYSTDIVEESGIAFFGGYYTGTDGKKWAFMAYYDADGFGWMGTPFPINGRNVYHRPLSSLRMSSDTMGWAVGEREDSGKKSILYQYPFPNYTVEVIPDERAVRPGNSTQYTVQVNSLGGADMSVALDLWGLPAGVTYAINPGSIDSTTQATMTLNVGPSVAIGKYQFYVSATATIHSGDNDIPVMRYTLVTLNVTNHPVYSVSPDHGPAGTVVTITGEGFGSDPGAGNRSTNANHVVIAGQRMPTTSVLSWSNTSITVRVPDDVVLFPQGPVKDMVYVQANNTPSNDNFDFQLENYIEEVATETVGDFIRITLTGTSFGNDPGYLLRDTEFERVTLGGEVIPYWDILSWSNDEIIFQVPKATSLSGKQVIETSNGYPSNGVAVELSMKKIFIPLVRR